MKYRKKPIVVEALQWQGYRDHRAMYDFLTGTVDKPMTTAGDKFVIDFNRGPGGLVIKTLEGEMFAQVGDYIIKGVRGEFYPCKPDIFAATYETPRARTLPTRDQIARAMYDVLSSQYGDFNTPYDAADAVLALLKGQDA